MGDTNLKGRDLKSRLRASVERSGLTKTQISRALDTRWQTVHDWIDGDVTPKPGNLKKLAEVLGVTLDELLGVATGQDPPFAAWKRLMEMPEAEQMSSEERKALASFYWPEGTEPTVAAYLGILGQIRGSKVSSGG